MKRLLTAALVISLAVSFAACGVSAPSQNNGTATVAEATQVPETPAPTQAPAPAEFPNFSKEQILADFDELFANLDANYPYFITAKNIFGTDRDEVYARYRAEIEAHDNVYDFNEAYVFFTNLLFEFGGTGHLRIKGYDYFNTYGNEIEAAKTEAAQRSYNYMGDTDVTPYLETSSAPTVKPLVSPQPETPTAVDGLTEINDNLSYKIVDDKTAYLRIKSFASGYKSRDMTALKKFYAQVKDYENLIIDITENGGGDDGYWMYNIVQPNITESESATFYGLMKSTGIHSRYANDEQANRSSAVYQFVAAMPNITKEILDAFDVALADSYDVDATRNEKMYPGKIYLLVGGTVYSASEGLARFAKETGFATLVGSNTGGNGGYLEMLDCSLSNTGFLYSFASRYLVNDDGTDNEAVGTAPDVYAAEGQSAFDACMELLN